MSNPNLSSNIPYEDWQIVAELKLPVGSNTGEMIHAWLVEALDLLKLNLQFLARILSAAQDASERCMRSESTAEAGHLYLLLYAPKQPASDGQTWGFFQIEKAGRSSEPAIEFYLYPE